MIETGERKDVAFVPARTDADLSELFYKMTNHSDNDAAKPWTDSKYVAAMTTIRKLVEEQTPCAAVPERASDEELMAIGRAAQEGVGIFEQAKAFVSAVRARVEAPLLAEIQEHRRHVGIVMSREAELKARVAELEALYGLETAIALKTERDALRAELEAAKAERDEWRDKERITSELFEAQSNDMGDLQEELEAAKADLAGTERQLADCGAELLDAKAALRQPVDADAWKDNLHLQCCFRATDEMELCGAHRMATVNVRERDGEDVKHGQCALSPADAARAAAHAASYAAAHGCPVSLPAHETRPVKVRFTIDNTDKLAEQLNNSSKWTWNGMMIEEALPVFAAHAVIDVPQPAAPNEPTAAEVEALARVLCGAWSKLNWENFSEVQQDGFLAEARAAFAHIPSRSNAEMQICINRKNKRIDALKACVKKWKVKAMEVCGQCSEYEAVRKLHSDCVDARDAALARVEYLENLYGHREGDLRSPLQVELECKQKDIDRLRAELEARDIEDAVAPIASADTLEKLADVWDDAFEAAFKTGVDARIPAAAAILRAAKPRVDVEPGQSYQHGAMTYSFDSPHYLDWLDSRIVYGVQLPDERAEMPSAETLAEWVGCDRVYAASALKHLRPWLHTPTGWELAMDDEDVLQIPFILNRMGVDRNECIKDACLFIKSRIRPTFGPCKECASRKPIPSEYDLANIFWKVDSPHTTQSWSELAPGRQTLYVEFARAVRAALEGE